MADTVLSATLRLLWGFRMELTILITLGGAWGLGYRAVGPILPSLLLSLAVVASVLSGRFRRFVWKQLRYASVRRRFASGLRAAGFDRERERTPMVLRIEQTAAGYALWVRMPPGTSVVDLSPSPSSSQPPRSTPPSRSGSSMASG